MKVTLASKILERQNGLLFYGLTPPKAHTDAEKVEAIAAKQRARLNPDALGFTLDGIVVYDLQDESTRTHIPRPFPFMETLAPEAYAQNHLGDLPIP